MPLLLEGWYRFGNGKKAHLLTMAGDRLCDKWAWPYPRSKAVPQDPHCLRCVKLQDRYAAHDEVKRP